MTLASLPFRRQLACFRAVCWVVLVLGPYSFPAAAKNAKPGKPDYKRQVEQLEEQWRVAQLNDDLATMDKLLSDDYVGITMKGQVVTKTQQLERMRTGKFVLTKIELNDVKVKLIGTTAIVTSQAEVDGTNEGVSMHGTYRYTRVYTRLPSGVWKITNFEATRVGGHHGSEESDRAQGAARKSK